MLLAWSYKGKAIGFGSGRSWELVMDYCEVLKRGLMLGGAFAIGYPLAMLLHEVGHAIAFWCTGGSVMRISVHPFSWSYTYGASSLHPQLVTWAGALFGIVCGLSLLFSVRLSKSPWLTPVVVTALCALLVNGLYLGVDAVMRGGGDGTSLARMGTPVWLLMFFGGTLILAGTVAAAVLMPRMGLTREMDVLTRLIMLAVGIGPYLIALLVYHAVSNPDELRLWTTYVVTGCVVLVVMACLSSAWATQFPGMVLEPGNPIKWAQAMAVSLLGVAVVSSLLLISSQGA